MFLRVDKLQIELPKPKEGDPNAASAVQELLGGRFGEMSTLMNYMYQSFNFREKKKLKPYYDLIANISAEELGHIELVSATVNALLEKAAPNKPPHETPFKAAKDARNTHHFIATGQATLVGNSMGQPWQGDYVFNSGNLVLDLLHNFFLEVGARTQKMRVYQMTDNPVAREMVGYLLVRGGTHALAYAKALETLTGVEIKKMLPIPDIDNNKFPEARKFEEKGMHRTLYRFSLDDYKDVKAIWNGTHPDDGKELVVSDSLPEGGPVLEMEEQPESYAPGVNPEDLYEIAQKLLKNM
ncbi:MAG: manganese catalase family protein [Novibacillus thermophilus]|jgi:Mn-containing catalase|uniref:Manganese catalase n=1 Tax=Novibacillus thermophilus TaxID=1471761 RepID=A0A1U9K913_9BACL|nr:manganese catalase family protein [Novibacillus thermophilus]AQS56511.1 manganese catalase [Novibacillus thermophilus]